MEKHRRTGRWSVRYQLYIDSFLFLNLMLNGFVLLLMEKFTECRLKMSWRFAGAALGTAASCGILFLPGEFGTVKAVVGQLAVGWVLTELLRTKSENGRAGEGRQEKTQAEAGGMEKRRTFAQVYGFFWISSVCIGGMLTAFRNLLMLFRGKNPGIFTEAAAGGFIVWMLFVGIDRYRMGRKQSIFPVELWQDGRCMTLKGLIDSGNSLTEPLSGTPVCLMGEKSFAEFLPEDYRSEHPERFRIVPFHSVGKAHGLLNGFLVERIVVHRQDGDTCRQDIVLARLEGNAASDERYQIILNRCFVQ